MKISRTTLSDIQSIISQARERAVQSINFEREVMYWKIGERILLEEQEGKERADYGSALIKSLADVLVPEYRTGFSARQLERFRQFYSTFSNVSALRTEFNWTRYKLMLSIDNQKI